jgi:formamidopyrimidine-DNA glycosylase
MPEFAEVNLQVKYLRERCIGWQIASYGYKGRAHFKSHRDLDDKEQTYASFFEGSTIENITQRGKQVIFHMTNGLMTTHFMFRGRWTVAGDTFISNYKHHRTEPTEKSNTLWLEMTTGERLNFHDTDYKGHASIYPGLTDPAEIPGLAKLGPEVLSLPETDPAFAEGWSFDAFWKKAAKSSQAIKVFLLDQKKQSGLGNMYVCESLYRVGVEPTRPAKSLSESEAQGIFEAATDIVRLSIESNLDYEQVLLIYNRETDPDGNPVEVIQVGGRDTYYVPARQK